MADCYMKSPFVASMLYQAFMSNDALLDLTLPQPAIQTGRRIRAYPSEGEKTGGPGFRSSE